MTKKTDRILTILAFAACATVFLIPSSATAGRYLMSPYVCSDFESCGVPGSFFYCGPDYYAVDYCPYPACSAYAGPAPFFCVDDYCVYEYYREAPETAAQENLGSETRQPVEREEAGSGSSKLNAAEELEYDEALNESDWE